MAVYPYTLSVCRPVLSVKGIYKSLSRATLNGINWKISASELLLTARKCLKLNDFSVRRILSREAASY